MSIEEGAVLPEAARDAVILWQRLRGTRPLPTRADFRPIEWRRWISDISVVEVHEGPSRYFVSLHGGRTQSAIGVNLHKRYIEEGLEPEMQPLALDPYRESERTGLPTLSVMTPMLFPSVFRAFPRLVLPFTDDTAEGGPARVDRFLTWLGIDAASRYDMEALCAGQEADFERCRAISERAGLHVLAA